MYFNGQKKVEAYASWNFARLYHDIYFSLVWQIYSFKTQWIFSSSKLEKKNNLKSLKMARQKTKTDTIRLQTDILSGISVDIPAGASNGYKVKTTSLISYDYYFCCKYLQSRSYPITKMYSI